MQLRFIFWEFGGTLRETRIKAREQNKETASLRMGLSGDFKSQNQLQNPSRTASLSMGTGAGARGSLHLCLPTPS